MQDKEAKFRHEFKYVCSEAQLVCLQHRINGLMRKDLHADSAGRYRIRSMYFDDVYHTCFYENENGTDPREKYRIRIYNQDTSLIRLECKRKQCAMTRKDSCEIDAETCRMLLAGADAPPHLETRKENPVWNRFTAKWNNDYFRPSIIVEYDRTTYVERLGNVRITFDRNISSADIREDFFTEKLVRRPVMPAGMQLLEVKYDEYLPDYIYKALELDSMQRIAFSKFYLCKKYAVQ